MPPRGRVALTIPTRETCAICGRISPVGFWVPDDIWYAVVHPRYQNSILCLLCFIARADERLVAWDLEIKLYPVSFATLLAHTRGINLAEAHRNTDDLSRRSPDGTKTEGE